jgi:fumarylacetoacetate (FAA) hydrolase
MIPEFDPFPIFYYTNHLAIFGHGEIPVEKDHLDQLDFELEVAVVIGKKGKNIPANSADSYIAGYTIMNDFSARKLQMEEMKLNLGPAKGKDFATSLGPYILTRDAMKKYLIQTPQGQTGEKYNLEMKAFHNGKQVSFGNLKDMSFTFAEIIERASYGVDLHPGDVIGSGTVGSGCYLELNGTWKREAAEQGKNFSPIWLQNGDWIELEVEALGRLKNKIVKVSDYSILDKIKRV